jgi:hypothetical protein
MVDDIEIWALGGEMMMMTMMMVVVLTLLIIISPLTRLSVN